MLTHGNYVADLTHRSKPLLGIEGARYTGYALGRLFLCRALNEAMYPEPAKPEKFRITLSGLGSESIASFPWLGEWGLFTMTLKQEFNYTHCCDRQM